MTDQAQERVGWTKAEYDQCPELAARLHRHIQDLEGALEERDRVLGELIAAVLDRPFSDYRPEDARLEIALTKAAALARTTEGGEADDGDPKPDIPIETRPTLSLSEPCPRCEGFREVASGQRKWDHTAPGWRPILIQCPECDGTGKAEEGGAG